MNNIDFDNLTDNIITKQDLVYLLDDINQAREVIYKKKKGKLSDKTQNIASKKLRNTIEKQEERGNLKTRPQQEEFLDQLENYFKNLPQIQLTLAFSPSDSFLEEISQWLKNQIGQRTIINLTVNPEIVGGAIIDHEGHHLDLALSKKIKESIHE